MGDVLLMTATIDPGPTPVLTLKDPAVRLQHYVAALLMWSKHGPFDEIVICENSGNGGALAEAVKVAMKHGIAVEVLTFKGNSGSWEFGKGFGEGASLEHAFERSLLIRDANCVWKSTGRLYVRNALQLSGSHDSDRIVMNPGDTRFYKIDRHFFRYVLQPVHRTVNDHRGVSIEVAYDRVVGPFRESGAVTRFHESIQYTGQDAGSGNWHAPIPTEFLAQADQILATRSA